MAGRRSSLIDQLAMAAALGEDFDFGSDDEESSSGEIRKDEVDLRRDQELVDSRYEVARAISMINPTDDPNTNESVAAQIVTDLETPRRSQAHPFSKISKTQPISPVPREFVGRALHSTVPPPSQVIAIGGASAKSKDELGSSPTAYLDSGTKVPVFGGMSMLNSNRRQNMILQSIRPPAAAGELDQSMKSQANSESEKVGGSVMAGTPSNGNAVTRQIKKFAVGDTVLVLLALLNVTNVEDSKDTFTVAPVNRMGFPQGEGRTDEEKTGPYRHVLATVNHVHFDEDDRYYTIVRADTGTEQRADSGWIEPLNDPIGIEAAARAAKLTVKSAHDKPTETLEEIGYFLGARDLLPGFVSWPAACVRSKLFPWYQHQRANAKRVVTLLVYGESPFAFRVHITGINFLVVCSTTFLFLQVVKLGFLPVQYDKQCSIVGVVVWSALVMELILELIVRPKGYSELIQSDRAFSPSTARHISRFHIVFESIALVTYIPEFRCIGRDLCESDSVFSRVALSLDVITGESLSVSARGRFLLGLTVLRLFGPIRHWKQMFINANLYPSQSEDLYFNDPRDSLTGVNDAGRPNKKNEDDGESYIGPGDDNVTSLTSAEDDRHLKNAATIGTALMVVNSQRALLLIAAIVMVVPLLRCTTTQNRTSYRMVDLLLAHNLEAPTNSTDDCAYLENGIFSWLQMASVPQPPSLLRNKEDTYVLWAQLLPVRCDFQRDDGVITFCSGQIFDGSWVGAIPETCEVWDDYRPSSSMDEMASHFSRALHIRPEGIRRIDRGFSQTNQLNFGASVVYNENPTVSLVNMGDFFVLLGILFVGLFGLNALRGEAIRLVLDPLQRMLKIVLRYAENPLAQDVTTGSNGTDSDKALQVDSEEIGNYETEQLINAITKIADLLRKCWGVAGAGIISSNLARTKDGKTVVFNPTVPGKRVYALFGFVAINGFSEQLRALERDVMILINDVAKVVHDEVYRWALGDHGQCNKNLGAAFLMVFRIGDFSEVQKKKQVATEKLFREYSKTTTKRAVNLRSRSKSGSSFGRSPYSNRKGSKHDVDGQLQLASLPGIQAFTDRALLGMLKSFAGVHRDKQLTTVWKNDFRLTAGVSSYHVDIIYGMDAGWAVEGAVGSEYKIDATYLSPHVNMASRMMSASKEYGVTILLSKAVEELLSRTCRKKLRHLDTVYVKGSKIKQEIFTYDARYQGVDFFLFERTPEQADFDAETYTPNIWEHDRDLIAMRQHVSDKFSETFHLGVKYYIAGRWEEAYTTLERADDIMMETVLADGYLEYDMEQLEQRILDRRDQSEDIVRIRHQIGDGACRSLMTYMERRNRVPPEDWDGVRSLATK